MINNDLSCAYYNASVMLDPAVVDRAEAALDEFGDWESEFDFTIYPKSTWSGLWEHYVFSDAEARFFTDFDGTEVRIKDFFPPDYWPSPSKYLLWWSELWLDDLPPEAWAELFLTLDRFGLLTLWDEIKELNWRRQRSN